MSPRLRPFLLVAVILVWLAIAGAGGQAFGKLSSVQENDNAAFLPEGAESTQAAEWHAKFTPEQPVPGVFVVDGVDTTLPLFRTLVRNPDILNGDYNIHWLEKFLAAGGMDEPQA